MKITQLEKTMSVLTADDRENMYFLERSLIRHNGESKPGNYNLFSTRVRTIPLDKLTDYIDNPNVVLVKVEGKKDACETR